MPATERLIQKLQETLGDDLTHDLVTWVDEARAVNRSEIREIADLYLARLDERLERRLAEFNAEFGAEKKDLDAVRIDLKNEFNALRVDMKDGINALRADLLRWMFIFWAGTLVPLAGLFVALAKL